jgi:hypothetical protein
MHTVDATWSFHPMPLPDEEITSLVVSPAKAAELLDCGMTRIYQLLKTGELQAYYRGHSRKILATSVLDQFKREQAAGAKLRAPRTARATVASLTVRKAKRATEAA